MAASSSAAAGLATTSSSSMLDAPAAAPAHAARAPGPGAGTATPSRRAAPQRRNPRWDASISFDIRVFLFSLALHGTTQLASLLSWSALPPSERFQRLLSIAYCAALVAVPLLAPATYLRWRQPFLILYRLGYFLFPLLRKPAGIQQVLDMPPQSSWRGAARDLIKVIWGSRLLAVLGSALVMPLSQVPLVPAFFLQLFSTAMVRSNGTLCATTMLTHPLSRQRIQALHHGMHLVTLLLPGSLGYAVAPLLQGSTPRQECEAALSFVCIVVGVLLPTLVLVLTEPLKSLNEWEQKAPGSGGGRRRLAAGFESALRQLCGRSVLAAQPSRGAGSDGPRQCGQLQPWQRAVCWWMLLSFSWAAAVEAHTWLPQLFG